MLKVKHLIISTIFLAIIAAAFGYIFYQQKNVLVKPTAAHAVLQQSTSSAEATAESAPSPSPSPSPVLTGYCLNVPILYYHHIQPQKVAEDKKQTSLSVDTAIFENQMAYLNSAGYKTISTSQLVNALSTKGGVGRSVIVTIDDGYADFYNFALPIIQKYHIHVDILIPAGLLNNPDYMTSDQLRAAISSGLVSIVNHTSTHANLASADAGKINYEITSSKAALDSFGQSINIFGWPYGTVNPNAYQTLKNNGLVAALSTIPGQTQCDSIMMSLHRTRVGNSSLRAYGL